MKMENMGSAKTTNRRGPTSPWLERNTNTTGAQEPIELLGFRVSRIINSISVIGVNERLADVCFRENPAPVVSGVRERSETPRIQTSSLRYLCSSVPRTDRSTEGTACPFRLGRSTTRSTSLNRTPKAGKPKNV